MSELEPTTELPVDPTPDYRKGTAYGLEAVAAAGFSFETALSTGERMRFALGPSQGVEGTIWTYEGRTKLDLATTAHVNGDEVSWPTAAGDVKLLGPIALERLSVELEFPGGAPPTGTVTGPRARAGQLRLDVPGLGRTVEASHVELDDLRVTLEEGVTRAVAAKLTIGRLVVPVGDHRLRLDQVVVTGVKVQSEVGEAPEVTFGAIDLEGARLELETGYLAMHELHFNDMRLRSGGVITVSRVRTARSHLVAGRSSKPKTGGAGKRKLPVNLSFMDSLEGHIHADISTHVQLPIIPDWKALHRVRLDVVDGRVEYRRLEDGLSKLPDAVLDFNLRDDGVLCLDKDIPIVPFDRTTLLSWTLSGKEHRHAEEGWIRLSHLLEPTVEIERHDEGRDEGSRYLQEVRIHDIDIALELQAGAVVTLPNGGRLRLGSAVPGSEQDAAAVEETRVSGEVVYRPDHRRPSGGVTVSADGLLLGVDGLPAGQRTVDAPRIAVAELRSEVKTRDLAVDEVIVDVDDLRLENVQLAPAG